MQNSNCSFGYLIFFIFIPLWLIIYLPQLMFWRFSKVSKVIDKDLNHLIESQNIKLSNPILRFLWAIRFDTYFVSLFYARIGATRAFLCSLTRRDHSTLTISCDKLGSMKMYHPFSTVLNAESIGDNFSFRNNTTIGNKSDNRPWERPIIGKNVTVGANVVIFGKIVIGDDVIIGAGAVVNRDIPSGSVVVGNPCRIL